MTSLRWTSLKLAITCLHYYKGKLISKHLIHRVGNWKPFCEIAKRISLSSIDCKHCGSTLLVCSLVKQEIHAKPCKNLMLGFHIKPFCSTEKETFKSRAFKTTKTHIPLSLSLLFLSSLTHTHTPVRRCDFPVHQRRRRDFSWPYQKYIFFSLLQISPRNSFGNGIFFTQWQQRELCSLGQFFVPV